MSPMKKAGIMSSNGIHTTDIKAHKLFTFRPLGDKGFKVSKGQIVQHIMSTPTKDLSNRDYLFVAATDADKKNYGGFFAALTKYRNKVDKVYKMEMTATNDLISPSKKERVNTFLEIYKEDPVKVSKQLAEFNKRNYAGQFKETTEELVNKYRNMSMRQLKKMGYYTYANSWFDPEAGTLQDMRKKLEKKGYNAIIDDNDKRSFIQSQAPLIVFNIMNNLGNAKITDLTTGEIRQNMLDWQNMKHSDELQHHGILGQRWGVRQYQNKDGTLTNAGKKRYQATREDRALYGEKGAKRIAERRNRGDSRRKAELKEFGIDLAKSMSLTLATTGIIYLGMSGKADKILNFGRKVADSMWDMKVVDSSRKVVARYRNAVSNGREVVTSIMKI